MPDYHSVEEAIKFHVDNYHSDNDQKCYEKHDKAAIRINTVIGSVPEGCYLLDIGCNSGGLTRRIMSKKGCFARGIDIIEGLVNRACRKGIYAKVGSAEKVPYPDNEFEVVLITEVLEHLYDPRLALKEIVRVLEPGGLIIGTVPYYLSENERLADEYEKTGDRYHKQSFSEKTLNSLLIEYFGDVEIKTIPYSESHCLYSDIPLDRPQWLFFNGTNNILTT